MHNKDVVFAVDCSLSAAAVQCAIMNPELMPPSATKNAGKFTPPS